jgi:group II intron reverse transcriptase/maturase
MELCQPNVFFEEQLYYKAWEKLAKTTTDAAGVDGVRIDDITSPTDFIESVQAKILSNSYKPSPVKEVQISKNGKTRTIGILTLEDRYVHMLVKCWLEPLCLPRFNKRSFAYQPGKSANQAIQQLETWLKEGYEWIGETDIRNFFDEIDHKILEQQLYQFVKDREKVSFILFLYSHQERGITQGSPLSPLLANIYLHIFDEYMSANELPYIRFSDDLIILDRTRDLVVQRIEQMKQALSMLKLSYHPDKTAVKHISETFEFLGFQFDEEGRKIAAKGIKSLQTKLQQAATLPVNEKIVKYEQILRGWYQYYDSIPWETFDDSVLLLYVLDFEQDKTLIQTAYEKSLTSLDEESITSWHLHRLFKIASMLKREKEQLYWLAYLHLINEPIPAEYTHQLITSLSLSQNQLQSLINLLQNCIQQRDDEIFNELIDWLVAERLLLLAKMFHDPTPPLNKKISSLSVPTAENDIDVFTQFLHIFSGREDAFLIEQNENGKRVFVEIHRPLTVEDVEKHFCGEMTIAQYIIRSNKTVNYALIDVDIPKNTLQAVGTNGFSFDNKRKEAFQDAYKLYETAKKNGFPSYLVDSGFRGYHVWFFFAEPIQLKTAYDFLVKMANDAGAPSEGIAWELFPKQRKLKEGAKGQAVKLPWGKHSFTQRQAWFVDENGEVIEDQLHMISTLQSIQKQAVFHYLQNGFNERVQLNENTISKEILTILLGCPVVRHMVDKAKQTNYLTHQERLLLLNVFAPLGADGKDFIHQVISQTFNYNRQTTEKFIRRSYNKPISCVRIREHFPSLTAQLTCNCHFPIRKGMYPSPVLHSCQFETDAESTFIKSKNPQSEKQERQSTNEETVRNVNVNELVQKMIQLRKHKRGISEKLKKIEVQLEKIFEEMKIDRIEIDQGYLIRKQTDNEVRWVIEL